MTIVQEAFPAAIALGSISWFRDAACLYALKIDIFLRPTEWTAYAARLTAIFLDRQLSHADRVLPSPLLRRGRLSMLM